MASFIIAGDASSRSYARVARLADCLLSGSGFVPPPCSSPPTCADAACGAPWRAASAGTGAGVGAGTGAGVGAGDSPATVQFTCLRKHPSAWPAVRAALIQSFGIQSPPADESEPLICNASGKYVGTAAAFEQLLATSYGITLDISDAQIDACVAQNMAEAEREHAQAAVLASVTGRKALLIIDVQNDFCEGGSLAVADADSILPLINRLRATCAWDAVLLTQDWHPEDHVSFASNNAGAKLFETRHVEGVGMQVMWPDHCVQGTRGADFHPHLDRMATDVVVRKGTNKRVDSYSGFGDAHDHKFEKTEMDSVLRERGITDVFVVGLALDYCVAYTCKDARRAGYNTFLVLDACRPVGADTAASELEAMRAAGVHIIEHTNSVPTRDVEAAAAKGIVGGVTATFTSTGTLA